jgi:dual specificity protein kinase YAK1
MANREAFIDFVHGLLNINPLERWTPQQARTHPFITQQKFTGPFQPQMNLKQTSRSPAPGVQQQQQAEALSRQRAQQAQAAQVQQAASAGYAMHGIAPGYPTSPSAAAQQQQQQQQQAAMYQNMYSPSHQGAPPPYPSNPSAGASPYGQHMIQQPPPAAGMHPYGPQQQQNLYAQATTRATRQRASTMDGNGIPPALQRVVSHLDPNQPIRLQPSPAYYPPPQDGQTTSDVSIGRRRTSRAGGQGRQNNPGQDRNFIRMLEDRTLEEGWNGGGAQWPGSNV